MNTILVVDDEKNIRETLKDVLEDEGYAVSIANNGREALETIKGSIVDVVLLDLWLPEIGGMDVLKTIKSEFRDLQVIIITGHGSIDTAVKATKIGAFDFIEKPLSIDRVLNVVDHAVRMSGLQKDNRELRQQAEKNYHMVPGKSKTFSDIEALIDSCAQSNTRVFITGENGTGKEVIARRIHLKSSRKDGPFVAVNCAAIPQTLIESELFGHRQGAFTGALQDRMGKFEVADNGTIFLDEIADMSLEAQAKVLRVLEEMQVERVGGVTPIQIDVRVIAATNRNITEEIRKGRFREDLYYRLNVVPIHVPSLRERREDIPLLIDYYLHFFAVENNKKKKTISREANDFLVNVYTWPGNIRELKNLVERLTILTLEDSIELEDVRKAVPVSPPRKTAGISVSDGMEIETDSGLKAARDLFEKNYIGKVLRENEYNISKAARVLKVERSNLYKLMKRLGIGKLR
jgi:two-component system nitrogen regulation response regulator NtrX